MAEENFDKLRQLLSQKADNMPHDAYFDGILGELHRRQRAAMIPAAPNRWRQAWNSLVETFNFDFALNLSPGYRYATAAVAACALGLGAWGVSLPVQTGSQGTLASTAPLPPATAYITSAAPVDDNFDVLPTTEVTAASPQQPHYMLTAATPTDTYVAF
ncbi:hypothetical protein DB346_15040 [Verrucomicrobia bacterium LW23]|nr:hypothetical protein DB346_15040 [Verrucomicrobia bacterium LW23]